MSSGGGVRTVTTQQSSGPWAGQQPYLSDAFQIARQNLTAEANGSLPAYYPGSTVAPRDQWTDYALRSSVARGMNAGMANGQAAEGALGAQATQLLNAGATVQPGYQTLAQTASGGMLGRNPEFNGMVQRAVEAARPGVDSAFAASGRLGSGNHMAAFSDAAMRTAGNLAYGDYQQERGNQLNAANQLTQNNLAAMGLGGQFANQASGNDWRNIQQIGQVGNTLEGYDQQNISDQVARWTANSPQAQLQRYLGLVQGNYGSEGTAQQPVTRPNMFMQGAGTLGSLAGGLGMLAMGLSDVRAKKDIRPVGKLDNGLNVYAYRYKGDDTPQIGLLAQEVAAVKPEAVGHWGAGLLGVDYDKATR